MTNKQQLSTKSREKSKNLKKIWPRLSKPGLLLSKKGLPQIRPRKLLRQIASRLKRLKDKLMS